MRHALALDQALHPISKFVDRFITIHLFLPVTKHEKVPVAWQHAYCAEAVIHVTAYQELWLRLLQLLQEEHERGSKVGLDISTGEPLDPQMAGIFDNYLVKKQVIQSAPVIASQLLLVDEVMRAGVGMRGK